MGEIAGQGGFTNAVRPDQQGVGCVVEKVESHQRLEGPAIDGGRPTPVEVAQWFEAADMRALEATLEAASGAFFVLPVDQRLGPAGGDSFRPVGQEAVQM